MVVHKKETILFPNWNYSFQPQTGKEELTWALTAQ